MNTATCTTYTKPSNRKAEQVIASATYQRYRKIQDTISQIDHEIQQNRIQVLKERHLQYREMVAKSSVSLIKKPCSQISQKHRLSSTNNDQSTRSKTRSNLTSRQPREVNGTQVEIELAPKQKPEVKAVSESAYNSNVPSPNLGRVKLPHSISNGEIYSNMGPHARTDCPRPAQQVPPTVHNETVFITEKCKDIDHDTSSSKHSKELAPLILFKHSPGKIVRTNSFHPPYSQSAPHSLNSKIRAPTTFQAISPRYSRFRYSFPSGHVFNEDSNPFYKTKPVNPIDSPGVKLQQVLDSIDLFIKEQNSEPEKETHHFKKQLNTSSIRLGKDTQVHPLVITKSRKNSARTSLPSIHGQKENTVIKGQLAIPSSVVRKAHSSSVVHTKSLVYGNQETHGVHIEEDLLQASLLQISAKIDARMNTIRLLDERYNTSCPQITQHEPKSGHQHSKIMSTAS